MTPSPSEPRRPAWRAARFVLGFGVLAGVLLAYQTGGVSALLHQIGLHSWAAAAEPTGHGQHGGSEHAGHEGAAGAKKDAEPSSIPGYTEVTVSPERQQLIGVRKGKVERDRLLMSISAVGMVEPDQTRLARIHTRISGWVKKTHVNYVGQDVKLGDPLLEIYSPDLLATQEEYLIALEAMQSSNQPELQRRLVEGARRRLELWGVSTAEIKELEKTKKARETLLLRAPISGRILERNVVEGSYVEPSAELYRLADLSVVWVQAKVYQFELPHIELNQPVCVSLLHQPEKMLHAKVAFIEPVLQEMTRTVKVRVPLDNPKGQIMPGMYADLRIDHDMGEGLLIPESAVLRTGERSVAFRTLPGGRFQPVLVTLGARFGERFQVLSGLKEGEEVVTSAAFLIDAESRLKATGGMSGGHKHGSGSPSKGSEHQHEPKGSEPAPKAPAEHHH